MRHFGIVGKGLAWAGIGAWLAWAGFMVFLMLVIGCSPEDTSMIEECHLPNGRMDLDCAKIVIEKQGGSFEYEWTE